MPASTTVTALSVTSPSTIRRVVYAFDMRIDARDPQTGYAEVSNIRFGDPTTRLYAFYMRACADLVVPVAATIEASLADGGIPRRRW